MATGVSGKTASAQAIDAEYTMTKPIDSNKATAQISASSAGSVSGTPARGAASRLNKPANFTPPPGQARAAR